jgi:hypothetical protein
MIDRQTIQQRAQVSLKNKEIKTANNKFAEENNIRNEPRKRESIS